MPTSLNSLKLMFFFWQVGLVDTFSLIQSCFNSGSQYGGIVVASTKVNTTALIGWTCLGIGLIGSLSE